MTERYSEGLSAESHMISLFHRLIDANWEVIAEAPFRWMQTCVVKYSQGSTSHHLAVAASELQPPAEEMCINGVSCPA